MHRIGKMLTDRRGGTGNGDEGAATCVLFITAGFINTSS